MSQTIDTIFLSNAEKNGNKLALTDSANRARLGLNTIEELTYTQASRYIRRTSAFLRQAHFSDGDIVIVQLPNIAETPLILLSIINAGLVPCMIPSHWRKVEIEAALKKSPLVPSSHTKPLWMKIRFKQCLKLPPTIPAFDLFMD